MAERGCVAETCPIDQLSQALIVRVFVRAHGRYSMHATGGESTQWLCWLRHADC
jgi:hypothetical protein